ncbi:hypothetical protein AHAS_Ahas15G0219000 [Arachis hypogaea]
MNGPLEQTKRNLEPSNSKDEGKSVGEEVEKKDEEASVSREISMKNEVEETLEPDLAYSQKPLEMTREHEKQNGSTIGSMIERYEEEMKKCWEDQQTSSMKELLKQMLSVKEEVEEQESEKDNQRIPNSSEAEKYTEEELTEPPLQEALDEKNTLTITQPPRLGFKKVKAINKNTEKRIVTRLQRTTFKRRSTTNNPSPELASKLNQAVYRRRLAEKRLRKGTTAETFLPLRSFLLTNWKKRKKVKNNMSS